jgi:periplasmic protein CpxP/Spy
MKRLIITALLVVSISTFAQEQNQSGKKSNKPKKEKMSPEQRNQVLLDRMTTELTLTTQQQEQIKPIIAEQSAKMEAMRNERMNAGGKEMTKEEREVLKTKREEDKKLTDAKLSAILTPEQFRKMKENEDAASEKMKNRMRESRANGTWSDRDNGGDMGGNREDN